MAGNPSVKKRAKEAARREHQVEKALRRQQRKADRASRVVSGSGEDPDLTGILPGPQLPATKPDA